MFVPCAMCCTLFLTSSYPTMHSLFSLVAVLADDSDEESSSDEDSDDDAVGEEERGVSPKKPDVADLKAEAR